MVKNTDKKSTENNLSSETEKDSSLGIESEMLRDNDQTDPSVVEAVKNVDANTTEDSISADNEQLASLTTERDLLKDQLLRALADTENMRRRSEREAETARKYGHTQFARDLVGAIDNLARALASAPEDKSKLEDSVQSLLTGIELSWSEIQAAIKKHGVRQIEPLGEKFDYNFHQAMFEVPTCEQPPGVVLEVVQHGYALHDRLLRPAMVGVSKAVDPAETTETEKK